MIGRLSKSFIPIGMFDFMERLRYITAPTTTDKAANTPVRVPKMRTTCGLPPEALDVGVGVVDVDVVVVMDADKVEIESDVDVEDDDVDDDGTGDGVGVDGGIGR